MEISKPECFNEIGKFDDFVPEEGLSITLKHDYKASRYNRIVYYRDGWWWTSSTRFPGMTDKEMYELLASRIKKCKEFAYQFMNKRMECV